MSICTFRGNILKGTLGLVVLFIVLMVYGIWHGEREITLDFLFTYQLFIREEV